MISPVELAAALNLPAPTAQQQRVIAAPLHPHIIIAGAGSGKTETIAGRVVWLVANGLARPEEILGLTFTRKAAGELVERVGRRLRTLRASGLLAEAGADLPSVPTMATYNSYAASLVRDHGLRVGVEPTTRLLGEAACWQLAYDLVERWNPHSAEVFEADSPLARRFADEGLDVLDRATGTIVTAVLSLAGQCAEHLCDPDDIVAVVDEVIRHAESLPKDASGGPAAVPPASSQLAGVLGSLRARAALVPVVEAYRRRKRDLEAMDFGDQVRVAADLAALPDVAQGERRRFSVVLLDEFQDTSHAQLELLARLFGSGHPVTAVGDPNQSIYGWRGASSGNLAAFRQRFSWSRKRAAVLDLTTSWRNPRSVLDVANHLAGPLRQRSAVPVQALTAAPTAALGRVRVGWHETSLDEAAWLAGCIARRWDGATTAAVVCRRRAQFPLIEEALREAGLPVEVVGIGGLLQRPEVADVIATLQVVADPERPDALVRLLTGPRWQIGPRDLVALGAWSRELARKVAAMIETGDAQPDVEAPAPLVPSNLVEAVENLPPPEWVSPAGHRLSDPARRRLTLLVDELGRLRRHSHLPLVELVGEVERALMIEIELSVSASGAPARAQLDEFTEVAAEFTDGTARPTLPAFLAWLAAAAERERGLERADEEPERPGERAGDQATPNVGVVQVLTVHAAKGLEWDVVAVPGLVEDRFPSGRRSGGRDSAGGWPSTLGELPFPLRGDVEALPVWHWRSATDLAQLSASIPEFRWEYGEHEAQEERRLIYVATTRARHELLLSGFVWDRDVTRAREPSRYLREVCALSAVQGLETPDPSVLDAPPADDNPLSENPIRYDWPPPAQHAGSLEAAELVRGAISRSRVGGGQIGEEPGPDLDGRDLGRGPDRLDRLAADVDRLLAERSMSRAPVTEVAMPTKLSASQAVHLARDRDDFAASLRRPMPVEPLAATRRGTSFHEWIERRLHSQALVDLTDLVGAGDDDLAPDADRTVLQVNFESSVWSQREVLATEIDIETTVADTVLRGRIDAVFAAPRDDAPVRYDIVDWKTGSRPRGEAARAALVQLAVYRLAWARLRGVPLEEVRASFCYLSSGETVTPTIDLDEQLIVDVLEQALPDHLRSGGARIDI